LLLGMQEAEAAAIASAAELADIRAKATFILSHLQPPVSDCLGCTVGNAVLPGVGRGPDGVNAMA
jgi:hypothetical protein